MEKDFVILVADRNPRIRNFVERELRGEGYRVHTAETAAQLTHWLAAGHLPDVLVLDPDLPGSDTKDRIWPLLVKHSQLPVVFHCLATEFPMPIPQAACTVIVEKSADSIDLLKRQIALLLKTIHQG